METTQNSNIATTCLQIPIAWSRLHRGKNELLILGTADNSIPSTLFQDDTTLRWTYERLDTLHSFKSDRLTGGNTDT